MLLLATYENQLTAYHFNKNIRTYIFFTTLLINVILSEREQEIKCFPKNIMVSSKGQASLVAQTDPNTAEPIIQRRYVTKLFSKSWQNLQEKTRAVRPATLLKRDFSEGDFF